MGGNRFNFCLEKMKFRFLFGKKFGENFRFLFGKKCLEKNKFRFLFGKKCLGKK